MLQLKGTCAMELKNEGCKCNRCAIIISVTGCETKIDKRLPEKENFLPPNSAL
jgi:hypothetical protein